MLKNYFKTALRNLSRNRIYAILNVVGLALGIGFALVIFKVISYERSFDKHQEKYESIYRVVHQNILPNEIDYGMGTPHPVGPALVNDYPEVSLMTRTHEVGSYQVNIREDGNLEKFLVQGKIAFTENNYFKIFSNRFIAGDPETVLSEPNTAVISKSLARLFFDLNEGEEEQAMGRLVGMGPVRDFTIVGVIEDPAKATNFPFELLLEYKGQDHDEINPYFGDGTHWNSTSSNTNTWFVADNALKVSQFNEKLLDFVKKYYDEDESRRKRYVVQALSEVHSDETYGNYSYSTSKEIITALTVIAVFLILTACINFVNLATAQAANRSKEIGIRKAIGGFKTQLIVQFFTEITLITFVALLGSLAIAEFLFIHLEDVINTRLQLDLLSGFETLGFLLGLLVLVSFLSGFYPSILLSRMNTVMALKNKITAKNSAGGLNIRKALVVTQFAISQFLIIGTVIISAQMDYFLTKDLGFDQEAIIKTYLPERNESKNELFRAELKAHPEIENVSFALSSPTGNSNSHSGFNYAPLKSEEPYEASFKTSDENYMELYGLELVAGRNLQKNDSANQVVINQRTADLMGFRDNYEGAVGETLSSGIGMDLKVIGVMKNFHSQSLREGYQYVFLHRMPSFFYEVAVKTAEGADIRQAVDKFEAAWDKVYPEYVKDWNFFDEQLAANYEQEQSISYLMRTFSIVSIIIGCLGLYGLIAFISSNRTKEVGIRKVLGASVISIIRKFSLEIFVLVAIAFAVAAPLSYFVMDAWLSDYEFRIPVGIEFFAIAFVATMLIATITVSHRTITTALINPARTLKDE